MRISRKFKMSNKIFISFVLTGSLLMTGTIEKALNLQDFAVEAASAMTYQTTGTVNMRSGAGKNYKVVTTLATGTKLTSSLSKTIEGKTWYKTTVKGKTGWVSGNYLKKVNPSTGAKGTAKTPTTTNTKTTTTSETYQTTVTLNMRKNAGKTYGVVTTVPKGKQLKVTQSKKVGDTTWYKTTYGKHSGWVSGKNLKKVTTTASKVTKDAFNLTTGKFFTNIYSIKKPNYIHVLVNKNNQLSSTYVPANLRAVNVTRKASSSTKMVNDAATALEKMFAAAKKDGVKLGAFSGYRSYSNQKAAYAKYKDDRISARPGHSEHQTGLAMDIVAAKNVSKDGGTVLVESFGKSIEGKWLAKNAHQYGFIIRYPKGKEKITGYNYEPWHVRYVGKETASKLHAKGWTLEEAYINGHLK